MQTLSQTNVLSFNDALARSRYNLQRAITHNVSTENVVLTGKVYNAVAASTAALDALTDALSAFHSGDSHLLETRIIDAMLELQGLTATL